MFFGNIYISDLTSNTFDFPSEFNIVDDYMDIKPELPTLIIDWREAYNKSPKEFDILNRKLKDNWFWTFLRKEKRDQFEIDLYNFKEHCYNKIIKESVSYININLFDKKILKTTKKILKKIEETDIIIYYITNTNFLYFLIDKTIFGLNLNSLPFLNVNEKKLLNKLKNRPCSYQVESIDKYKKYLENIDYDYKYLPYIHYLSTFKTLDC
jgi:hypothetical protein